MSQAPLFGEPDPEPTPLPAARMPWDAAPATMAQLRDRARPCQACGASIVFALVSKKSKGREVTSSMPIDVEPALDGNVHVWTEGRTLRGHVFGRKQDRDGRHDLHRSHFAPGSCTNPEMFRKRSHR